MFTSFGILVGAFAIAPFMNAVNGSPITDIENTISCAVIGGVLGALVDGLSHFKTRKGNEDKSQSDETDSP